MQGEEGNTMLHPGSTSPTAIFPWDGGDLQIKTKNKWIRKRGLTKRKKGTKIAIKNIGRTIIVRIRRKVERKEGRKLKKGRRGQVSRSKKTVTWLVPVTVRVGIRTNTGKGKVERRGIFGEGGGKLQGESTRVYLQPGTSSGRGRVAEAQKERGSKEKGREHGRRGIGDNRITFPKNKKFDLD